MAFFTSLFTLNNREVKNRKKSRFVEYLRRTADGSLFEKPKVDASWTAHMEFQSPPEWGMLQSSYDDVEKELNRMRRKNQHNRILFVGGDGLSILRINHLLVNKSDRYIHETPMIIPVQGEAPHGVYHIMHGGWRLYQKFIRAAADATLGSDLGKSVTDDPNIKHFNSHIFTLWWMTRACAEYLLHLSQDPGAVDIDLPNEFSQACERNFDLAYIFHFLYDFAFLVLDFKQCVRGNKSKELDILWREFYALGRTGSANKTQYVPMSVMRVFWGLALEPNLNDLYHSLRALPTASGAYVGWDTPIEWLNGAISSHVKQNVSESRIAEFIENYSLLEHNYNYLMKATGIASTGRTTHMKSMDCNVNKMKGWLIANVGANWAIATRAKNDSALGISSRGKPPWQEVDDVMQRQGNDSVSSHVSRVVRELTHTFYQFSA